MAHQPKTKPLDIGASAPDWTLQSTNGTHYSINHNKGAKATVVAFSCNHCPYVKAYDERINDLAKMYNKKGVQFFVINSNDENNYPDDSFEKMKSKAETHALAYPYLRDEDQKVAYDYGAGCTPEFFVFDHELRLTYTGRLDDNMEDVKNVKKHYLKDAIEATINGKEPNPAITNPIGCSIKWSD